MRCGAGRSAGSAPLLADPASKRGGGSEEACVSPHDHIDLDAAEARIVERVAHQGERHVARG